MLGGSFGGRPCYHGDMPDRTSKPEHPLKPPKRSRDFNSRAFQVVAELTGQSTDEPIAVFDAAPAPQKNPAAVALGRLGGLKGGRARAEKLAPKKRSELARAAAIARWKKKRGQP